MSIYIETGQHRTNTRQMKSSLVGSYLVDSEVPITADGFTEFEGSVLTGFTNIREGKTASGEAPPWERDSVDELDEMWSILCLGNFQDPFEPSPFEKAADHLMHNIWAKVAGSIHVLSSPDGEVTEDLLHVQATYLTNMIALKNISDLARNHYETDRSSSRQSSFSLSVVARTLNLMGRRNSASVETLFNGSPAVELGAEVEIDSFAAIHLIELGLAGVTSSAEQHEVKIDVQQTGLGTSITVDDTGGGIDPSVAGNVFQMGVSTTGGGKGKAYLADWVKSRKGKLSATSFAKGNCLGTYTDALDPENTRSIQRTDEPYNTRFALYIPDQQLVIGIAA
ncbi:MAG: hypothetical protein ACE5DX_02280 [Candidatus Dojkabacteria bacterium]